MVALLKLLISDALEIALGFEMLAVPAAEERREIREGVSDCVVNRFVDIVDSNRAAAMKALLSANEKEKNAWCDPRVPRFTQPGLSTEIGEARVYTNCICLQCGCKNHFEPDGHRRERERERERVYACVCVCSNPR